MTAHRFLAGTLVRGDTTSITGSELHHLRDVLRLGAGDHILVADAAGTQFAAVLQSVDRQEAVARIIAPLQPPRTSGVTLFVGLLKGAKMDLVVQKATELGAEAIVPVLAQRSVARLDQSKAAARLSRWRRLAAEACKQCGRSTPPAIEEPVDVTHAAQRLDEFQAAVVFWEGDRKAPLSQALGDARFGDQTCVLVGPEGGFTEEEMKTLTDAGAACAGLGELVLRSETAAIAGLAIAGYELSQREGG